GLHRGALHDSARPRGGALPVPVGHRAFRRRGTRMAVRPVVPRVGATAISWPNCVAAGTNSHAQGPCVAGCDPLRGRPAIAWLVVPPADHRGGAPAPWHVSGT